MCQMPREVESCEECFMNCLLKHQGQNDHSPKIPPFFKVMYGKKFSEQLFVPPKFSRILVSSVGKKACLEDLTGQKWEVVLSDVQGSVAFQEGWRKFSLDHGLDQGDFVVFRYVTGSRFIVEIYGKSGYEKSFPSVKSYQNKRPKTSSNSPSDPLYKEREPSQRNNCFNAYTVPRSNTDMDDIIWSQDDVNNLNDSPVMEENVQRQVNVIEKPQLVPDVDLLVEPCFLNDRETNSAKEANRVHLLDLSAFESPNMNPSSSRKGDADNRFDLSISNMTSEKLDAREDLVEHLSDQPPFQSFNLKPSFSMNGDRDDISNQSTSKMIDKKVDNHKGNLQGNTCSLVSGAFDEAQTRSTSIDTKKFLLTKGKTAVPSKNYEANLSSFKHGPVPSVSPNLPSNLMPPPNIFGITHTCEPSATSGSSQPPNSNSVCGREGGTVRVVKQEPRELKQDLSDNLLAGPLFGASLSFDREAKNNFSGLGVNIKPMEDDVEVCKEVKAEPVDFCDSPLVPASRIICLVPSDNESFLELPEALPIKWRQKLDKKHKLISLKDPAGRDWPVLYHKRNNLFVLASGWKEFRKANKICSGDECAFVAENTVKGAFQFQFLNR
ncbi:B3 domain-containing protein Os01g0905400-like isoform X1 [Chenopodium quinoa]|nr:B3 domain-containing protein Os01g0905400-like isoform X1 [Chenopodium quinoa]